MCTWAWATIFSWTLPLPLSPKILMKQLAPHDLRFLSSLPEMWKIKESVFWHASIECVWPFIKAPRPSGQQIHEICRMAVAYFCLVLKIVYVVYHTNLPARMSLSCFPPAPLPTTPVHHFSNKLLQGLHASPHYMQHCFSQVASIHARNVKADLDMSFPAVVISSTALWIYEWFWNTFSFKPQMYATLVRNRKMCLLVQYFLLSFKNRKNFLCLLS